MAHAPREWQGGPPFHKQEPNMSSVVVSEVDDDDRLVRRYRRTRDGREVILIDNRLSFRSDRPRWFVDIVDLPPIVVRIPRERYVVDYSRASDDDLYDAIAAEPLEPLSRRYSLEEVRWSYPLRERMRRVDLDDLNRRVALRRITPFLERDRR
jgi:hypothetical protein